MSSFKSKVADRTSRWVDFVFTGPPGPGQGGLCEVEDEHRCAFPVGGEWVDRGDGTWALRIRADELEFDGD